MSRPPRTSNLAVAAFVLALVPFYFVHLVGLGLGLAAWSRIERRPRALAGRSFAVAAVAVGTAWTLVAVVRLVAAAVRGP